MVLISETGKAALRNAIDEFYEPCNKLAKWLTEHPEITGKEKESSRKITEFLRQYGYEVEQNYCSLDNAFRAQKKIPGNKKKIALMCEFDALPEIGHACGHSVSCGISILSALAISRAFEDFEFQVDLIGTPMEEDGGGKIYIAERGGFNEYELAAMVHLSSVNIPYEKSLSITDMVADFKGIAAHASDEPWNGRNAMNGVQLFYHAIDMLRQHIEPDDQIHGIIQNCGAVPNVVPESATALLFLRSASLESLNKLYKRVEQCARGAAMATETQVEVKTLTPPDKIYSGMVQLPTIKNFSEELFRNLGIDYVIKDRASGSTDAGNVSRVIPTFHPYVQIGKDKNLVTHSREFAHAVAGKDGEQALMDGAVMLTALIAGLAENEDILKQIKLEHQQVKKDMDIQN